MLITVFEARWMPETINRRLLSNWKLIILGIQDPTILQREIHARRAEDIHKLIDSVTKRLGHVDHRKGMKNEDGDPIAICLSSRQSLRSTLHDQRR